MKRGGLLKREPQVLVGIIKDRRDLNLLLDRRLYRIPVAHSPRRPFEYLGFYQTAAFGKSGKCIRYIAPVLGMTTEIRSSILPDEPQHPRANDRYRLYRLGKPVRLPRPIRNLGPRRFNFAYTSLRHLFESHDILEMFGVPPIERLMAEALKRAGIPALPEFTMSAGKKRYRLDFAVFCRNGALAIECDGEEFHNHPVQARYDRIKDKRLNKLGWKVLRLKEGEIVRSPAACLKRVKVLVKRLGGLANPRQALSGK